jgi:hypothetical protein
MRYEHRMLRAEWFHCRFDDSALAPYVLSQLSFELDGQIITYDILSKTDLDYGLCSKYLVSLASCDETEFEVLVHHNSVGDYTDHENLSKALKAKHMELFG